MRILLVNKYWYLRGGAERVAISTKELLEAAGHTVAVFGMHHPDNVCTSPYFIDYIDYTTLRWYAALRAGVKALYNREAKKKFAALVAEFQPDVVHFHNIYHQLSFSLLDVIRRTGIPAVMTLHDYQMISSNYALFHHGAIAEESLGGSYYRGFLKNNMEQWGESLIAMLIAYRRDWRHDSEVIGMYLSPSVFLKTKFVQAGWDESRITVVPNPLWPIPTDIDNRSVEQSSAPVVFFGRLSPEKGLHILLDAAALTPQIPYELVGTGPMSAELQARIEKEHLNNVTLVGFLKGEALFARLRAATLIVLPAIWYENAPQSIVEATALGQVVIATNIGGTAELLPADLLCPPWRSDVLAERIREWYHAPAALRKKVGDKLREVTWKRHDAQTYVQTLEGVYAEARKQ